MRVEKRRIDRVRVFSADCELDAGGLPVSLLTGVKAADSLALLESIVADVAGDPARAVPDSVVIGDRAASRIRRRTRILRLLAPIAAG